MNMVLMWMQAPEIIHIFEMENVRDLGQMMGADAMQTLCGIGIKHLTSDEWAELDMEKVTCQGCIDAYENNGLFERIDNLLNWEVRVKQPVEPVPANA